MVVFTCQHCGSSLQKNKVENHLKFKCRKPPYLTCVDCLNDFRDNEYVKHTECIRTENQRYGGKGFVAKESPADKRKAIYAKAIESLLGVPDLKDNEKRLIIILSRCPNLPHKRDKFHNFVANRPDVMNRFTPIVIDKVFDLIEEKKNKLVAQETPTKIAQQKVNGNNDGTPTGVSPNEKRKKKDKKRESVKDDDVENGVDESRTEVQAENGLSKKEKKAKRKREKYEAELNEIETLNTDKQADENQAVSENCEEDEDGSKKKKKKKDKRKLVNSEATNGSECDGGKKKKRRHEDNAVDEPISKKSKAPDSSITENANENGTVETADRFKWDEAIIKVLESRSDKELAVKRLSKKVINEYQAVYGEDHMTFEKLMSKFNKKINKIPGVKVLKDKAKLVTC